MKGTLTARGTVVDVFESETNAQKAVRALKAEGFTDLQIGVAAPVRNEPDIEAEQSVDGAAEGAGAGVVVGLGAGALWGLGIVAGILPGIGPAIAGGTLAAILSSAAVGAGAAGLGGALIGLGFGEEDVQRFESEFQAGKTIVTVKAGDRADVARAILERFRWDEADSLPDHV